MSEWEAFIIGAVIVIVFSYERFNRVTYESERLKRLVDLVSPDKMRARSHVVQAWFAYTVALIVIYVLMCTYFEVFVQLGFAQSDGAVLDTGSDKSTLGIPTSVSLTSALVLVGMAPSTPGLKRCENWLREMAHSIAGIPARMLSLSEKIRLDTKDALKKSDQQIALLPETDAGRINSIKSEAGGRLVAQDDFKNDLRMIFAVSYCILDRNTPLKEDAKRHKFEKLEDALRERRDRLRQDLDALIPAGAQNGADTSNDLNPLSWEKLVRDVRDLVEDLSIMLALYVMHGIVPYYGWNPQTGKNQGIEKPEGLLGIISAGEQAQQVGTNTAFAFLWSVFTIIAIAFFWSIFPGNLEIALGWNGDPSTFYTRLGRYSGVAISYFAIPILISLSLRDVGRRSGYLKNLFELHWTKVLPQVLGIVLVSWTCTVMFIVAYNFWLISNTADWQKVNWDIARQIFNYNALYVLRGSVLGLILVWLLDGHKKRYLVRRKITEKLKYVPRISTWFRSFIWGICAALIMAAFGGMARIMASVVSALEFGRSELDAIDRGLILYAAVYSAIIGFFVVFMLSEALRKRRPVVASEPQPGPSPEAPEGQGQASLVIFGLALLVTGFANHAQAQDTSVKDEIVIAVREDTPPFAYIAPSTGSATGFFYRICIDAVTRAGYQFTEKPINIDERNKFLKTGSGDFDLLCDPTTITLGRIRNFSNAGQASHLEFSQIVFVANGTYATFKGDFSASLRQDIKTTEEKAKLEDEICKKLKKSTDQDPRGNGDNKSRQGWFRVLASLFARNEGDEKFIQFIWKDPDEREFLQIWGSVSGTTMHQKLSGEPKSEEDVRGKGNDKHIVCSFNSHKEAAQSFCRGQLSRYYGDADIIRAAIAEYGRAEDSECQANFPEPIGERTNEPYAFVLSSKKQTDFPEQFSCALYSMFQDGTVSVLAKGRFPNPTKTLEKLFAINKINIGEANLEPNKTVCGIKRPLTEISQQYNAGQSPPTPARYIQNP